MLEGFSDFDFVCRWIEPFRRIKGKNKYCQFGEKLFHFPGFPSPLFVLANDNKWQKDRKVYWVVLTEPGSNTQAMTLHMSGGSWSDNRKDNREEASRDKVQETQEIRGRKKEVEEEGRGGVSAEEKMFCFSHLLHVNCYYAGSHCLMFIVMPAEDEWEIWILKPL